MIKASQILVFTIAMLAMGSSSYSDFPQAEISNGIIHARFYLPDPGNGYYRGTRFDWSGVSPEIKFKGHSYCGQWFAKYDPTLHDAIMGPVEAFSPLGYDQSLVGGTFVTIGVGSLVKTDIRGYSPYQYFKISDPGTWKITTGTDRIEFLQTLNDRDYSYQYKKTAVLVKEKPDLVLLHELKNTGNKIIETDVYNHNLFTLDNQTTGPPFTIRFPFTLVDKKEGQGLGVLAAIQDKEIVFKKEFIKSDRAYTVLEGYKQTAQDYQIQIENHKTGAAVRITADQPLSKLVFWACPTTLCPEPYIHLKINPGDSVTWKITYQFYTCDIQP